MVNDDYQCWRDRVLLCITGWVSDWRNHHWDRRHFPQWYVDLNHDATQEVLNDIHIG
jgi:hypothetical protein